MNLIEWGASQIERPRWWFPSMFSSARIGVNKKWGGMIDAIYQGWWNQILVGPGDAGASFQMAAFDPDMDFVPDGTECGDTQRANGKVIWNPTQSGSCGEGSWMWNRSTTDGHYLRIMPRLFEAGRDASCLLWEQRIDVVNPNLYSVFFQSHHSGAHKHPKMHGRYTAYLQPGFTKVLTRIGYVDDRDLPRGQVKNFYSLNWCALVDPKRNLAFALRRPLDISWSVEIQPTFVRFGQGKELTTGWDGYLFDQFDFLFGTVERVKFLLG